MTTMNALKAAGVAVEPIAAVTHAQVLKRILDSLERQDFKALYQELTNVEKLPDDFVLAQKHYVMLTLHALLESLKSRRFELAKRNDFVFVFNGDYWKEIDRDTLKHFLKQAAEKLGVSPITARYYEFVDKLYKQFLTDAHFEPVEQSDDSVLINLQNGTFEIGPAGQQLREFRAADFLRHQLPFRYDPAATAPRFQTFLDEVLPDRDQQNIIAEYLGYIFTRDLKLEKSLLLHGNGANGKSVVFDVTNALLGRENVANYSLSDLLEEHNRAQIANKLLNYGSEINASVTKDTFKNLVSGEPIMARLKYGNSFMMENYAKLAFNCNELPRDIEHSDAYFRRLIIIHFAKTIAEKDQDKDLAAKIIASELSGVFNWVIGGLRRLLANRKFTQSAKVEEAVQNYRKDSDSVAGFLEEQAPESGLNDLLKTVYSDYKSWAIDCGFRPIGRNNFSRRLQALGYRVEKTGSAGRMVFRDVS